MAGHSQFKNIMYRKGAQDKKRASVFTKIAREIQLAVKNGGNDPATNPRLYRAMALARGENMPKDNVQRAIDRALGAGGEALEEIRYEGFGPGGTGLIVECLTDNRNRTAGDVRSAFTKHGGNLGAPNSVVSGFERVGEIRFRLAVADENTMMDAAIEAGAEDVILEPAASDEDPGQHIVFCGVSGLGEVTSALQQRFGEPVSAKFIWKPQNHVEIAGDAAATLLKLVTVLDDLDDVQAVFGNYTLSDAELAKLAG